MCSIQVRLTLDWRCCRQSMDTDPAPTDNAIPIEGWISDPTDNDLLHLIPLLEGLQYVTDVRALLALRLGMPSSV